MRTVLFDLDGTLTDPKIGITRCIQHALETLGRPAPPEEELLWCIGPPLAESFAELLGTDDAALVGRALVLYRERFSLIGMYENELYPGVPEMLATLRGKGFRTCLATSKPRVFAARILEHFQLASLFDGVYGSELDGTRSGKADLIAHLLEAEGLHPGDAVMVGDREHDMAGGTACGVRCLGVTYGYGSEDELRAHGATRLAQDPAEVVAEVERLLPAVERFAIPGVGGLIRSLREDGEWILVQERDKAGARAETGLLEIPAGKVRAFENVYDCLRREIKEETGLDVTWIHGEAEAARFASHGYDVVSYMPYSSSQNLLGEYPIMVQTFLCEVGGSVMPRSDESRNIRWISLRELRDLVRDEPGRFYPMHLTTLRRYVAERQAAAKK